jgi:hypothetical protein
MWAHRSVEAWARMSGVTWARTSVAVCMCRRRHHIGHHRTIRMPHPRHTWHPPRLEWPAHSTPTWNCLRRGPQTRHRMKHRTPSRTLRVVASTRTTSPRRPPRKRSRGSIPARMAHNRSRTHFHTRLPYLACRRTARCTRRGTRGPSTLAAESAAKWAHTWAPRWEEAWVRVSSWISAA